MTLTYNSFDIACDKCGDFETFDTQNWTESEARDSLIEKGWVEVDLITDILCPTCRPSGSR